MGMSHPYGGGSDADSIAVIHRAIAADVTLFDTADMYGLSEAAPAKTRKLGIGSWSTARSGVAS